MDVPGDAPVSPSPGPAPAAAQPGRRTVRPEVAGGAVAVAALVVAVVVWGIALLPPDPPPVRVEAAGPFEIVTVYGGTIDAPRTRAFTLRYKGQPWSFQVPADAAGQGPITYESVDSVLTFPSKEPVFVVNVAGPGNRSLYYLVREQDGQAVSERLGEAPAASVDELGPTAVPGGRGVKTHRIRVEHEGWVLLGDGLAFDTRTRKALTVPAAGPGIYVNGFLSPLDLSPDEHSLVRFATVEPSIPVLLVADFVGQRTYTVPIDRQRMRYSVWEDLTQAWVRHHFEWRRDEAGTERLQPRERFAPWPWKGRLAFESAGGYREYRLEPVTQGMQAALVAFLERSFGARRLPPDNDTEDSPVRLKVGEAILNVSFADENHASVWADRDSKSAIVKVVAERFDAELATGKYDELFVPPTPPSPSPTPCPTACQ